MSRYTLLWRRTRKNALSIHSGRPPCANRIFRLGKSTATSSTYIGSPYLLRAPGKIDVPVCTMTGVPLGFGCAINDLQLFDAVQIIVGIKQLVRRVDLD